MFGFGTEHPRDVSGFRWYFNVLTSALPHILAPSLIFPLLNSSMSISWYCCLRKLQSCALIHAQERPHMLPVLVHILQPLNPMLFQSPCSHPAKLTLIILHASQSPMKHHRTVQFDLPGSCGRSPQWDPSQARSSHCRQHADSLSVPWQSSLAVVKLQSR